MSDCEDYIYEDAPLVEVIAEVRWKLLPIESLRGAAIDPNFEKGHQKVKEALSEVGLTYVEQLFPAEIPTEMLAGKPIFRIRPSKNTWPLVQLGPGVLTVNIAPPYEGWAEFRKTIAKAVRITDDVFGFGSQFSQIQNCELRYIDAFTEQYGMRDPSAFLGDHLSMQASPPHSVLNALKSDGGKVLPNVKFRFPVDGHENDFIVLSAFHGERDGQEAIIYELRTRYVTPEDAVTSAENVLTWMDAAHERLHVAFESSISDELRARFGKTRPVRTD